ncbi:chondroitin sulfate proteoglycan 5 [Pungitius pungitius]|uniref:chondroitin sulfate proteoglycan 5 n=1 Tax=Pungitius pungitius TaxID=134920 RepID=UPI002E150DAE
MQGKEASFCAGCWRLTLLSCVLALHLVPLSVHGNVVGSNATEPDHVANMTSHLTEEEEGGPLKGNEAVATVTAASSSAGPATATPKAGRVARAGEEDEQSSGMFGEAAVPAPGEEEEEEEGGVDVAAPPQLSPDSAETEHLLPSNPRPQDVTGSEEEEGGERLPQTDPPWIHGKDTAVFDMDRLFTTTSTSTTSTTTTTTTTTTTAPPLAPTNPAGPDVLHVDFFDPSSRGRGHELLAPPSPSSLAHELQGGDTTSWAMPDNYDYLTPYEDGASPTADEYAYSTTPDAYEGDVPGPGSFAPGAALPGAGAAAPNAGSDGMGGCRAGFQMVNGSCRSPCDVPPNYCFNGGQCYLLEGMGVFCRYDVHSMYCTRDEISSGMAFASPLSSFLSLHHVPSSRPPPPPPLLTVVLSSLPSNSVYPSHRTRVLLHLSPICLHHHPPPPPPTPLHPPTPSSKYRPSSEQHNDNFSLSTIAEGSHPNVRKLCDTPPNVPHARALAYYDNIICQKTMSRYTWECKTKEESDCEDDPNSQNKLEDPVKAPPKEDDSLNIHNSLTPKHENHKVLGEENSSEVNSLQNNMM